MKEEKVVIKQILNPDNPNVGIKYVGAKEYVTIKTGQDGKNVTGLDENALEIINLPGDQAKKKSAEIKKKRENLEKLLNKELHPDSPFWTDFMLVLEDELTLDPTNPRDQLIEIVLVANRYVAPCEDDIKNDERYHNTLFYMYRAEEVATKTAIKSQVQDKATARLFSLNEDNPQKLKIVASYIFGFDAAIDVSVEQAYLKLREFITDDSNEDMDRNIKTFLDVCQKSPEELMLKQIFDKAVKKKLIRKKGETYGRGTETYGTSYEEALEYLALPENSGELAHIQDSVK